MDKGTTYILRCADNKLYVGSTTNIEFASTFQLNTQQAYRYLDCFKGIDFVDPFS